MNRVNYNLVLVILVIITWCSTSLTGSIVNEKVNSVDSEFIKKIKMLLMIVLLLLLFLKIEEQIRVD